MFNRLKKKAESLRNTLTKSGRLRKKFAINSNVKFIVHGSSQTQSAPANDAYSGFGIFGSTRPKQCPLCRSQDQSNNSTVTRLPSGHWKCKSCEHEWR